MLTSTFFENPETIDDLATALYERALIAKLEGEIEKEQEKKAEKQSFSDTEIYKYKLYK